MEASDGRSFGGIHPHCGVRCGDAGAGVPPWATYSSRGWNSSGRSGYRAEPRTEEVLMNWSSLLPPVAEKYQGPRGLILFLDLCRHRKHRPKPYPHPCSGWRRQLDRRYRRGRCRRSEYRPRYLEQWGASQLILALFYWVSHLTVSVFGSVYAGDRVYRRRCGLALVS